MAAVAAAAAWGRRPPPLPLSSLPRGGRIVCTVATRGVAGEGGVGGCRRQPNRTGKVNDGRCGWVAEVGVAAERGRRHGRWPWPTPMLFHTGRGLVARHSRRGYGTWTLKRLGAARDGTAGARGDPSSPLFCARPGGGCRAAGPAYPDTGRGAPPNCPALCPPAPPPSRPPAPRRSVTTDPLPPAVGQGGGRGRRQWERRGGTAGSCLVLLVAVGRFFKQSCRRAPASRGGDGLGRPCVSTMGIRTADVAVVGGMTSPRTGSPSVRPRWAAPPSRPASRAGPGRGHPPPPQQPA